MSTPPSLCNLPTELAKIIFNEVGLRSIQSLRKVCRDLRFRIDDIKPEGDLTEVYADVTDCKIRLMYSNVSNEEDTVEYQKSVESGRSIVRSGGPEKIVNSDFMELASQDFLLILKFQEKSIITITFSNETENSSNFLQFLETLHRFLTFEHRLLNADQFTINTIDQKSVITALSLTNPQAIEYITFANSNEGIQPMEFSEIIEMEHWKKAKYVISESLLITGVSVRNFFHFSSFSGHVQSISVEELLDFKRIFENSTEKTQFIFSYTTFEDREQFLEKMGPPEMDVTNLFWFFPMSTTDDDILSIELGGLANLIIFKRCSARNVPNVPEDDAIQN